MVLYNLLSAFKRLGLPEELHRIRPKWLRILVLNTLARLICHARERELRFADGFGRSVLARFRIGIRARSPPEAEPLRRPTPQPARPDLRTTAHGPTAPPPCPPAPSAPIQTSREGGPPPPNPPTTKSHGQIPPKPIRQPHTLGMSGRPTLLDPASLGTYRESG